MYRLKNKLIICGFALLLFGINIAIVNQNVLSYVFSGLGLTLIVIACFANDDEKD